MAVDSIGLSPNPVDTEATSSPGRLSAFNQPDGPGFSDLLDIINPLQHIPLVNIAYQAITGDKEGGVAEFVGGALWGGMIGIAGAVINMAVEDQTGQSIGDNIAALFDNSQPESGTQLATDVPAPTSAADRIPEAIASSDTVTDSSPAPTAAALAINTPTNQSSETALPASSQAVVAGEYLVFGGTPSRSPLSLLPAASATPSPKPKDEPAAKPAPLSNPDFLVFGESGRPASQLPEQIAKEDNAIRYRPLPPRTGPAEPKTTLPMPTTGPAAVPGYARAASATRNGLPDGAVKGADFVGAFTLGLDKYQKAAKLGDGKIVTEEQ